MSLAPRTLSARAILFDLDGVLVDSEAVVVRTWHRWSARHDVSIPDLVRRAHGRRTIETIREIAPHLNADEEVRWLATAELSDTEGLVILAGAQALYTSVPEGHRAVVTSCGRALAELRLSAIGLDRPGILVAAEDIPRGKPAPDGYRLAAERLGVDPEDCVVVEDTPAGIAAGRAAGATVLGVATTFAPADLQRADVVVPSLAVVKVLFSQGRLQLTIDVEARTDVAG